MRQQSAKRKLRRKSLPIISTRHYVDFSELLREQLQLDQSPKALYLSEVFESKLSDGAESAPDDVRRTRAIEKWLTREEYNRDTNRRIMFADEEDFLFLDTAGFPVSARDVVRFARQKIAILLGDEISWDALRGSFSGGASTSVKRGVGVVPRKYQVGKDITHTAFMAYAHLTRQAWMMPRDLNTVHGNVLFTVPKTSQIDRVACKEPELNMYCQKAVGDFIRQRLKTVRIDLDDQSVNQELARIGSIDGTLATIDLSSASDSVTTQLVIELLPFEWSALMLDLRSPFTNIDGEWHENQMIASMGNGFTFELESLIFWALVKACAYFTNTRGVVSVYGDDIICPVGCQDAVEATLEFFGFTMNPEKSHWEGPFRESCGKHWHSGVDITPFYVKRVPTTIPDWCLLLNSLRRWSSVAGVCDPRYYDLWSLYSELVPRPLHGSRDLSRKDALVDPTNRNIAVVRPTKKADEAARRAYQSGAYLQWLNTNEIRTSPANDNGVDQFAFDGRVEMQRRSRWEDFGTRDVPVFPQELED